MVNARSNAFSVIEVVVVVTVIAVLAAMFVPKFASAEDDSKIIATASDLSRMAEAFDYYKSANGYWPPETGPGQMPPEMRTAFRSGDPFSMPSPIGGVYDYDNVKQRSVITITITGTQAHPGPTLLDAQLLDAQIDDGNLSTGNFRKVQSGFAYAFNRK